MRGVPAARVSKQKSRAFEIIYDANDFARAFDRMATARGVELPMELIAPLVALFEQALKRKP